MKISAHLLAGFSALATLAPAMAHATEDVGETPVKAVAETTVDNGTATPKSSHCENGCIISMTAEQLLAKTQKLVEKKEYAVAKPLAEALGEAPGYELQSRFLMGFIAVETGDLKGAEAQFRAILKDDPKQTRVRLELGRVMMLQGKDGSADYHLRLAEDDKDLPAEIAKTVRGARSVLRDRRNWHFSFNLGLAPDSNINSATSAETVNINFGPFELPLTLDPNARQKSGIGQTGGFSGGMRLKAGDNMAILLDADGRFVNYSGTFADDVQMQFAAGPELKLNQTSSISLQGLAEQRWYGGKVANRDFGARLNYQKVLDAGQRIGIEIDGRHTDSHFADAYSGWIVGTNATYERIVARSFIASLSIFGRKDMLQSPVYSSTSYGVAAGVGGELPWGLNAGVSGSVSRAKFDMPQYIYSNERRDDWRFFGRAYLGARSIKVMGFSPSVEYSFSKVESNYTLYESTRHRVNFKLARYF